MGKRRRLVIAYVKVKVKAVKERKGGRGLSVPLVKREAMMMENQKGNRM